MVVAGTEYYEQPALWERQRANPEEEARAQLLADLVPPDARAVVDVGCGNGFITNRIRNPVVIGVDTSAGLLRSLRCHAVAGSAEALPLKEGSADVVILSEVLEHLATESLQRLVNEIRRLRPRRLIISVPEEEDIGFSVCVCAYGHAFHPSRHVQSLGVEDLEALFPEYRSTYVQRWTRTVRYSRWVRRLARALGIRFYVPEAVCPVCGGRAVPRPLPLVLFFRAFSGPDRILNQARGKVWTYHVIVVLEKREGPPTSGAR